MIAYRITNIVNGKLYFGITKGPLNKRWNMHKHKSRSGNSHLYCSIRKHGVDNFIVSVVKEFDNDTDMYEYEKYLIKTYNTTNTKFGYNKSTGGELSTLGSKRTVEQKAKISNFQKTRKRNPHTELTKQNMSTVAKGRDMSSAVMRSACLRKGKKAHNIKSVVAFDGLNSYCFDSITDASKKTGVSVSSIANNLTGRSKRTKKYIWEYKNKI